MKNKLFYLLIIIIAVGSLGLIISGRINDTSNGKAPHSEPKAMLIGSRENSKQILVEFAETEQERERGLSDRESISDNFGLLFRFEEPGFYLFWMKDMNFPIDIVWLDSDYKIVDITEELDPKTYPNTVTSKEKAQFILELKAGFVKENTIKEGDFLIPADK